MNIIVLGAGAIGSLWACHLQQAGHNVTLWTRQDETEREVQLDGHTPQRFPCNQTEHLKAADLVLVAVKAWQVSSAINAIKAWLHKDAILVFMHNGMGTIDTLSQSLLSHPIVLATTTHGALKTDTNHVKHTGMGITQLGGHNSSGHQCAFLQEVFNHSLPKSIWNPNVTEALWLKLAINCVINPLTALHQCRNGELLNSDYHDEVTTLINEIVPVLQANNVTLDKSELTEKIQNVMQATASNRSSMLQDIYYGRLTEIDYITGYLIQAAEKHGISVPENQSLYCKIKELESSRD